MNKSTIKKYKLLTLKKIILASESKRRKAILKKLGFKFSSITSNFDEEELIKEINKKSKRKNFKKIAELLSLGKTISSIKKIKTSGYVLGFDTIVVLDKNIISKPKNNNDALNKILSLSNKTHKVITGLAIFHTDDIQKINEVIKNDKSTLAKLLALSKSKLVKIGSDCTKVKMRKINKLEALQYIDSKEPFGKAGAYAIQGKGKRFVKKITGDFYNVVGLPVDKFYLIFKSINK